jgi:hypothetical protein
MKRVNKPKIRESNSDLVWSNYWIKIGLTPNTVKALTALGKRFGCTKSPCAVTARYLISLALLRPADTEAKLGALLKYIDAEGFTTLGGYCDHAIMRTGSAKSRATKRRAV